MKGTMGTRTATTNADIAAFKYKHPLDSHKERKLVEFAPGQYIIEQHIVFEIFAFHTEETGDVIFDVRGIKDALAKKRKLAFLMFDVPMNESWVEHIRKQGGVEVERMKALTAADLKRPGIAIYWPNGYTTVIDGNNRMVRRWDDGLRTFRLAVIPLGLEVAPYMCRPGEEESFVERQSKEDPRGITTLAWKNMTKR
jgi:hypothetical protein